MKESYRLKQKEYYEKVQKPRVQAFRNWLRNAPPDDILKFFDLK